ncbi:MAG: class I SAM-dependent methyltransferase, partial [Kamptonema sp. SIO4C4]|nr:class I SAM-dependent methyltransferase [Kamptonema sp. SIO4C4]
KKLLSPRYQFDPAHPYTPSVSPLQRDLIQQVRTKLETGEYKLIPSQCTCGVTDRQQTIAQIDRYGLPLQSVVCLNCGTVRIDPYLDEPSLSDFYTHIYRRMYGMDVDEGNYDRYFAEQSHYAQKVLSVAENFLTSDSWICEVGCGAGGALKYIQDQGYKVAGCEYDSTAMEMGKKHGVNTLFYGSLEAIGEELPNIKFDLIYLHHVFEHLTDPIEFLQKCKNYLTPQGKVIIIIPDISRIDQFGHLPAIGNALMYLHIAHKYNFSWEGIKQLCQRAGYSVKKLNPDPNIYSPWSESPELWVQMSLEPQQSVASFSLSSSNDAGLKMLKYLQRTEKLYSMGLCQGQVWNKFKALQSPQRVFNKLQKIFVSR